MQLKQYLSELNKVRLLEPAEEQQLWLEYKQTDSLECRRRLIESYQPLVFKTAVCWRTDEATLMDIIQEGTVGLIEAVENYDPARGAAFSLYASHRIRGRMINYLNREGKRNLAYIDSPLTTQEGAGGTLSDLLIDTALPVAQQAEHNFLVEQVKNALGRLPDKEKLVLNGVFLEDQEPRQLAETLDLSISHVYRLQKQGIRRIRGMLAKFMQNW